MAQISLSIVLVLCILFISGAVEPAFARRSSARAYIESSCRTTRYPKLCIQSLAGFANSNRTIQTPHQLAQLALSVSLYKARLTKSYMLKVADELKNTKSKDYQTVKDCLDQINDSVNQLSESIKELRGLVASRQLGGDDIFWKISNVETWLSSAQTDASTCMDEFPGRRMSKMKAIIKGKVLNVAQTASNALALFHRFAARYRASAAIAKP